MKNFIKRFHNYLVHNTALAGSQVVAFGIVLAINYPLYYFVWKYLSLTSYESLYLRALGALFCLLLIFKNYWPRQLKPFLPYFWYFSAAYCLPFFFTFMTLKNHASAIWLMNSVSALFFLIIIFDFKSFIAIATCGVSFAVLIYNLVTPGQFYIELGGFDGGSLIATYAAAIVIGSIFAVNRVRFEEKKRKLIGMTLVAASTAHELRTPLSAINITMGGVQETLPALLAGYQKADKADLDIPAISTRKLSMLNKSIDSMRNEIQAAFTFIEMLLTSLTPGINANSDQIFSMKNSMDEVLRRYPFTQQQRLLISCDIDDFQVKAKQAFVIHVFFNLIKNALYYIAAAGKGDIKIWSERGGEFNKIYFKDTGTGIAAQDIGQVFNQFFSRTRHGAGVGLYFSRCAMESLGGRIECESQLGEYTLFTLYFPCV